MAGLNIGTRWSNDTSAMLRRREHIIDTYGLATEGGLALVWLLEWDGINGLAFRRLDPFYIEVCRQIRLTQRHGQVSAHTNGTKVTRVDAKALKGRTGDPWTPVDVAAGKILSLGSRGYDYKLVADLLYGSRYVGGCAQELTHLPIDQPLFLSMCGLVGGNCKTAGFFKRLVPIAPKARAMLAQGRRADLAHMASERIGAIAAISKLLNESLVLLFYNGIRPKKPEKSIEARAARFAGSLELREDVRFFDDLDIEIHAEDRVTARLEWLIGLATRGEAVLRNAFVAGPRCGMQRYRAQSAALSHWNRNLDGTKVPAALRLLSNHLRLKSELRKEMLHAA